MTDEHATTPDSSQVGGQVSSQVGATFGVEEEFHVVDAVTGDLYDGPPLDTASRPRLGREIASTQVETNTAVCSTATELRGELVAARREAAAAAAEVGARVVAASTHPFASWRDQRLTSQERYVGLLERWGLLALQQDICGCHVHVSMPDLDTAVAVMDRARPYLPVLLALTGSSPFHEGMETGYDSFRTAWFARWPTTGPSELLGDAAGYHRVVEELQGAGVVDDATELYWDVRPSARYPTAEFRLADVCTDLDDAVLHAVLVVALCRLTARRAQHGHPPPDVRSELLRAARWRAARSGLEGELLDPLTGRPEPAEVVVRGLLAELREDLEGLGEWEVARDLTEQVLGRGTSAHRQRDWFYRGRSPEEIVGLLADATAG